MRELVAAGALGTVEHVVWTHHSAGSRSPLRPFGWLFDRERGGGWIGAWASHAIDSLRFTFGEITTVVLSRPRLTVTHRPDPDDEHAPWLPCTAEDGLSALLALAQGLVVRGVGRRCTPHHRRGKRSHARKRR
jgi:predicted dehydrogenase